ncbi:FAD-dependent oxidoreductase [Mycolicibacter minnesotensis]|uniref:FAD-dependent oxidoreductase n=1 Tax=Mycolicibacter minnesotensis TaxID=1118379 RepID=A0A7I7R2C9_9MYCO|nr:FAD-dependent oxidoreductase [Mycolicibacter minnesotensis]ORB02603.1 FAD-dependent oxidoreductase [Mycolicibacter minnesotensis]BBY32735.1 FAD-dependent oxidoreductase [Mycolicibacter minnesotensis]
MTSLWLANRIETSPDSGRAEDLPEHADVVVAGAGITGLMTALLLARAGRQVLVLEARTVGACATGNTTAKISLLQATQLSKILAKQGKDLAAGYLAGNRAGQDWLLAFCAASGVPVQREDAYSFAQSEHGVAAARAEFEACRALGLQATWEAHADTPFDYHGGVRLEEQAQFDPMLFLDALRAELCASGGQLLEHTRVQHVSSRHRILRLRLDTPRGHAELRAAQLVLATGVPVLDRGGYFARVKPSRSYCMAFEVPGDITRPMMISTDSPTRSLRYAPANGSRLLLVGGAGHTVGREKHPGEALAELESWTVRHYPGAVRTHLWSAQDYASVDELPYVGTLLPDSETIYVATGFNKWGMTNGAAAALALSGRILGARPDWDRAFTTWRTGELRGLPAAMAANLAVGFHLAKGWITPTARLGRGRYGNDGGVVSGPPWHLQAQCQVDGVEHRLSPVCPHLGGIVTWNEVDRAWECPLHGSRFAPDGSVLEGPATRGLTADN